MFLFNYFVPTDGFWMKSTDSPCAKIKHRIYGCRTKCLGHGSSLIPRKKSSLGGSSSLKSKLIVYFFYTDILCFKYYNMCVCVYICVLLRMYVYLSYRIMSYHMISYDIIYVKKDSMISESIILHYILFKIWYIVVVIEYNLTYVYNDPYVCIFVYINNIFGYCIYILSLSSIWCIAPCIDMVQVCRTGPQAMKQR